MKLSNYFSGEYMNRFTVLLILTVVALVKFGFVACVFAFFRDTAWAGQLFGDVWNWLGFMANAKKHLIPYVDFSIEYPHFIGYFYWVLSPFLTVTQSSILVFNAVIMTTVDVVNTFIFISILKELKARRFWLPCLFFQLNMTSLILSPFRFESILVFILLCGYLAHLRGHIYKSTIIWSLGFHVKWFPAFLVLARDIQSFISDREKRKRAVYSLLIAFLCSFGLLFLFVAFEFALTSKVYHSLLPYWHHLHRQLSVDTLLGLIMIWWGTPSWEKWAGLSSLLLMLFFTVFPRNLRFEERVVLIAIGALIFNRIYSTQFNLWFYPFLCMIMARGSDETPPALLKKYLVIFIGMDVANVMVYPFAYPLELGYFGDLAARRNGGMTVIVFTICVIVRALFLLALATLILRRHWSFKKSSQPIRDLETTPFRA